MATHPGVRGGIANDTRHSVALRRGIDEHLPPGGYALFFVSGEGHELPDGVEDASGYAIDSSGRVFSFWLGWDQTRGVTTVTEWDQVDPEPDWIDDPEYRRAREKMGLPP